MYTYVYLEDTAFCLDVIIVSCFFFGGGGAPLVC